MDIDQEILAEAQALFPDFQAGEIGVWEQLPPEQPPEQSPLIQTIGNLNADFQQAPAEEKLEALRMLLA